MKKLYTLLIAILITLSANAQAPEQMSYQAVIRDASNALVTSQAIGMQISVLIGSTTGASVYTETQTANTNTNGLVSLEIGTGTTGDDFSTIDWAKDTYFIKIETDPTGGSNYTVTGTSQLLSVPYALYAKTAENISGLEKITENGNAGWRLVGKNPDNYGDIGIDAVDLSTSIDASATNGASGNISTAMGLSTTASGVVSTAMGRSTVASGFGSTAMGGSTTASGSFSTAMGNATTASGDNSTAMGLQTSASGDISTSMGAGTTASGDNSTAMGRSTTASGSFSTAMGLQTSASGDFSTAMGHSTTASGDFSTAIGKFNIGGGSPTSTFVTDPLFEVGNGTSDTNRSNAFTILKNGTITAPEFDISEMTDDKALITKEYADANLISTGLEKITENGNTGWRLVGRNLDNYGDIGFNAIDLSDSNNASTTRGATGENSTAMGSGTIASGLTSTAMGSGTTASGLASTAMGTGTIASGLTSTAMGTSTTALGLTSTAMGSATIASGGTSTSMGRSTTASGSSSTAMGTGTTASGDTSTAMGLSTTASGIVSTAMGFATTASEDLSTAMGNGTTASGTTSTAMGDVTTASGSFSTAMGSGTIASGSASTAMGFTTTASGEFSTTMGQQTKAEARYSLSIGMYNIGGGSPTSSVATDPLFEVGNGANDTNRSNALTILKNGNTGIGTHTPTVKLHVIGGSDASLNNGSGYVVLGNEGGQNIVMDENEIMARNNGSTSTLFLQKDGGGVSVGGSVVHASDRRLKKDIETLQYGLSEILQLQPKAYTWKNRTQTNKSLGLIAQEVQPIIKEIVTVQNNKTKTLGISYTELIPILINAIKEQQKIIDTQLKINSSQTAELTLQGNAIKQLQQKMEALEGADNQ